MLLLGLFKDLPPIAGASPSHRTDDPHPDIGEFPHRFGMALAFRAFLALVGFGPRLLLDRLHRKQVQYISERFDTGLALTDVAMVSALLEHRGGPGQLLEAVHVLETLLILTQLCQQA